MNSVYDGFGRTMHIDTSVKLHKRANTGIAYKIIESNIHKGLCLKTSLKRDLRKNLQVQNDYSRLYAICIYLIIKDSLKLFDTLIICEDERVWEVKLYLDLLFEEDSEYHTKIVLSLIEFRKKLGNMNIKSYADGISSSYRKRALKCLARQQEGISLNPIKVNYPIIENYWKDLDFKLEK